MSDWWRVKDLVPFLNHRGGHEYLGHYARIENVSHAGSVGPITAVTARLSGVLPDSKALFDAGEGDHILIMHNPCGQRGGPGGHIAAVMRITEIVDCTIPALVYADSPDLVGFTVDIKAELALFGAE